MNFFNKTALSGENNRRLYSDKPTNSEGTAAWNDEKHQVPKSQVDIPSTSGTEEAKDWVDNGSRL